MGKPVNPKHLKFVERYLATGNATQSYIDAGYDARGKSAENAASRLLGSVGVREMIDAATAKACESQALTKEVVVAGLLKEANREGEGASHGARVSAWRTLAEIAGSLENKVKVSGDPDNPVKVQHSGAVAHKPDPGAFREFLNDLAAVGRPAQPDAGTRGGG